MSSNSDQPFGYVTIRIPVRLVTESESWEMPQPYTVLEVGEAELVAHDMPPAWHSCLREELVEAGIDMADWTDEEVTAACTRPAETEAAPVSDLGLFIRPEAVR